MKLVCVIAGNKSEFNRAERELKKPGETWRYISDDKQLRGLRNYRVQYVGTYLQRRNFEKIFAEIQHAELVGRIDD